MKVGRINTVQDFLNKLGIKPRMHLLEINTFQYVLQLLYVQNYEQRRQKLGTYLEYFKNQSFRKNLILKS